MSGGEGRIDLAGGANLGERLHAAPAPVVTAVLPLPVAATEVALIRATVAAVAFARAPTARVNAVLAGGGAGDDAVADAVAYLAGAAAVTGLTLEIGQPARVRPQGPSAESTTA